MKRRTLGVALVLSLLVNLGVVGALGYRAIQAGERSAPVQDPAGASALVRHLALDDKQRRAWHEHEADFLDRLVAGSREIREHRDRLVHEIFGEAPDAGVIEAERASIVRIQQTQQRLVIAQLLSERDLLDPHQRALLAQVLIDQPIGPSGFEQLHRDQSVRKD